MYYDKIVAAMNPTNMTPYIIEERQLNISQLDVFSRLMMDRIIFLGTGIDDQIQTLYKHNYFFLKRRCF
jgi:ATP-dependent Clp protease protease subunit